MGRPIRSRGGLPARFTDLAGLSGSIINAPAGIPIQIDLIDLTKDRSNATNRWSAPLL